MDCVWKDHIFDQTTVCQLIPQLLLTVDLAVLLRSALLHCLVSGLDVLCVDCTLRHLRTVATENKNT